MTDQQLSIEPEERREPTLVVITGMSGAGRTQAIHTFEDVGFFCIDNVPPALIRRVVELTTLPGSRVRRIAIVSDVRAASFFAELADELRALREEGVPFHLLFLEADDETLVNRFKETRRRHPLCEESASTAEAIAAEREALADVRTLADLVIDTSQLTPQQLRAHIRQTFFGEALNQTLAVGVMSFGFKHGAPIDADIVMDVRFLPNPYYDPEMRDLSGTEALVRDFVMGREETTEFLARWFELLSTVMPHYIAEGKTYLQIALGCTGGRHRSVVLAEETATFLRARGYPVTVNHRDIGRGA
ncbi:MAG: RNase adapter RapZ [Coriobacteriaceae bacterium]|nr:RNase adapter RapZ [Coriobacteriaceae bacterium]